MPVVLTPGQALISFTNIQDPSGQLFSNGNWILIFKETPNTPGPFTNIAIGAASPVVTRIFSGNLDANGSGVAGPVIQNTSIAPAGSKWTFIVSPNASDSAYQVDFIVNSPAFDVSPLINAAITTNITISATPLAHAYKDSEVVPIPGSGGIYYDVVNKILKVWDITTLSFVAMTAPQVFNPVAHQFLTGMNSSGVFSSVQPAASDLSDGISGSGAVVLNNTPIITTPNIQTGFKLTSAAPLGHVPRGTGTLYVDGQLGVVDLSDGSSVVTLTGSQVLTNKTLTSPVINGTPSGTGIPTYTLKKGTGAGNYTSASTTDVVVDGTNLSFSGIIPTGWKLVIMASGGITSLTAAVTVFVGIADGGTIVKTMPILPTLASNFTPFVILWEINGDGNTHTIDLRYHTTNGADSVSIDNNTATEVPTMIFILSPSN